MWQVLWLSPSAERTRPYAEASERKLPDVRGFMELVPTEVKEENKNIPARTSFYQVALNFNQ